MDAELELELNESQFLLERNIDRVEAPLLASPADPSKDKTTKKMSRFGLMQTPNS